MKSTRRINRRSNLGRRLVSVIIRILTAMTCEVERSSKRHILFLCLAWKYPKLLCLDIGIGETFYSGSCKKTSPGFSRLRPGYILSSELVKIRHACSQGREDRKERTGGFTMY